MDRSEVSTEGIRLLDAAFAALPNAHAPYSQFRVAAAVLTSSGRVLVGTNQENASYPVGICAERVVLSAASAVAHGETILSMAVVYRPLAGPAQKPLSPCGMCRQALHEQRTRQNHPIVLWMTAEQGSVWRISDASELLPFAFSAKEL